MKKEPLNAVIIYDDACPLCKTYTNAFVQTGLLKENNRLAFSNCPQNQFAFVDWQKAKNEIPLIELQNQKVLYGIDAMIAVIFQHQKWVQTILRWQPIYWTLQKLYKFISFNRKIIVTKKNRQTSVQDCTPDFHFGYRLIFIVCCFLCSRYFVLQTVSHFQNAQKTNLIYLLLLSIFIIPIVFLLPQTKKQTIEILGHCNLILLKTSFCMWLATFFLQFFLVDLTLIFIVIAVLIACMNFLQLFHRIQYIQTLHLR
jgi:predicted DCC family thiol-disulfide oxidoreductase YuxK